jgi:hypothetical protein
MPERDPEAFALRALLLMLVAKLKTRDPTLDLKSAFDDAARVVEDMVINHYGPTPPEHAAKVPRIIEEIREQLFGADVPRPEHE